MSEAGKAVFLSYASQDAEAAKRICEALRAAGVEVWFDQSELVGGDQWDAKIRGQISSCALFVPIISAATQARREGYFRLEWKLAAQRTHMIADGTPFILPVVIDATRDSEALVPSEFKSVQWSRLPAGGTPTVFVARMRQLLEGGGATETTPPAEASPTARPAPRKARWMGYGWAAVGIGFALFYALRPVWQQTRTLNEPRPASGAPKATAAETLVAKARALLADDPLATRASVILAEQLAREAVPQDQTNAEAHAVLAWASYVLINERYDDTPQRRIELRDHAEKARLLAPDSVSAEFAMCCHLLVADSRTEALARLQALGERAPDNIPVLFMSARAQIWNNKDAWGPADALYPAELAKLRALSPLGRAHAESLAASLHWVRGEYVESDRANDRGFATGSPVRLNYLSRLLVLLYGWGDLPAARAFVETIPSQLLLEDVFIAHVSTLWLMSGESDKALEVLARTPREMLREARILNPTAMLRGDALAAAGRPAAAAVQWREALRVVDQQLAADPANTSLLSTKAELLASLGDRAGAAATFALFEETRHAAAGSSDWASSYEYFVRLGDVDAVLGRLDRYVARDNGRWAGGYHQLRHDPMFAKVRADPRAQPILERAARWLEEMKSGRSTSLPAAPAATSAEDDKSVAVLAFANLSDDKNNEYFSDGISEELLNVLSKVQGLKVTARTSSFHFKGKDTPIPEIAKQLGVAYVVEGSVRKAGDKVRITAQLIKAADGFHVWSDTFTRELKDVFAVQDEIAGLIANNLSLKLRIAAPSATVNPEAFRLYLEGRQEWSRRLDESLAKAEELFKRAIALDPEFARAHAGLADVGAIRANMKRRNGQDASQDFSLANASLDRALQIDADLAEAHATRGNLFATEGKTADAALAFRRALALNPSYASAHQWYGRLLFDSGSFDAGLAELEIATRLDPLSPIIASNYGMYLGFARRWAESLAASDRALGIRPNGDQAFYVRTLALISLGRSDEALAGLRARNGVPGGDQPELVTDPIWRAESLARAGDREAAVKLAGPVLASDALAEPSQNIFNLYLALGRPDDAFAYAQRVNLRLVPEAFVYLDPVYDAVRDAPRFLRLVEEAGILGKYRDAWAQYLAWKKRTGQP